MASVNPPKNLVNDTILLRWLNSRQDLIVKYTQLAGKVKKEGLKQSCDLEAFGERMVDYLCEGHFEIYERLQEKAGKVPQQQNGNLSQIYQTTDIAMAFHDKYFAHSANDEWDRLTKDFSTLGEALSIRFELEDRLIAG